MIRKFVSQATGQPSNAIKLVRTQHGRPEICPDYRKQFSSSWPNLDFNVSHSGDYCVLVGFETVDKRDFSTVGVDVTKIVSKKSKAELDRFLSLMKRREFTPHEWRSVEEDAKTDRQKCINFTRLWCLKESYIKAIGLGLAFKLNRIEFHIDTTVQFPDVEYLRNRLISSTKVLLDGEAASNWTFLEGSIDTEHLVAIGYNHSPSKAGVYPDESSFIALTIDTLLKDLRPMRDAQESNWDRFSSQSKRST